MICAPSYSLGRRHTGRSAKVCLAGVVALLGAPCRHGCAGMLAAACDQGTRGLHLPLQVVLYGVPVV